MGMPVWVGDWVGPVVGDALVFPAIDSLRFGPSRGDRHGRAAGLDVDGADVHPRIADALVGEEP